MDILIKKAPLGDGYDQKVGDTVEDAELIFGAAQTAYFLETGYAEPVKGGKTEKATAKKAETPE